MIDVVDSRALLQQMSQLRNAAAGINNTTQAQATAGFPTIQESSSTSGIDFSGLLHDAVSSVNDRQQIATQLATDFEKGRPGVELSQVTIEIQKARIAFEALSQVRNKVLSAYQEIMNMPI